MSKFKVGDKVRRIDGGTFSNNGRVSTVSRMERDSCVWLGETGTFVHEDDVELVEDTSCYHKHHDLIIQWAKGAEIEIHTMGKGWISIEYPFWDKNAVYRIKPPVPKSDKERIAELEERVKELESKDE